LVLLAEDISDKSAYIMPLTPFTRIFPAVVMVVGYCTVRYNLISDHERLADREYRRALQPSQATLTKKALDTASAE